MTINTKYNVGDKVWVMHNNIAEELIIRCINIECAEGAYTEIFYRFHGDQCFALVERLVFATKEELIKSL